MLAMAVSAILVSADDDLKDMTMMKEVMEEFEVLKMSPALSFMQLEGYGSYTCWADVAPCTQSAGCCSRCCQLGTNTCGHSGNCKADDCNDESTVCLVDLNCCSICCRDGLCVDRFQCTKVQWWFILLVYITLPLCVLTCIAAGIQQLKRRGE